MPDAIAARLASAGQNRAQLEQAWSEVPAPQRPALAFLLQAMPEEDARTLTAEFLLRELRLAHEARAAVPYAAAVPEELFLGYVVPYAQANERREDWRSGFQQRFLPLVQDCRTPGEAALRLNRTIFDQLQVHYSTGRARADQAPSESIAQGKASCTGLSILLADACRACAIPARLVSVVWPHKAGNHTWVEVWDGAAWRFVGADEPDPAGLDRGWFVDDAAQAAASEAPRTQPWAVSFAPTGQQFPAGWTRGLVLHGENRAAAYRKAPVAGDGAAAAGQDPAPASAAQQALEQQLDRWFAAAPERRASLEFDRNLDAELRTVAGDARLRALVFAALRRAERAALQEDHQRRLVRAGDKESAFTVKQVGSKPAGGWPLVIAMHGGGGVPKRINDSQWQHMQVYYRDQPQVGGYLYCALRAPTDEWNGFYTDYFYPLLERLIRQFVVCDDVDPDAVVAIGYSHGGYGAFAIGPKLPHRFAAVHASAAAPTDGESSPVGLHSLRFSFMVGGKDTAYGRAERCQAFAEQLQALQTAHPGRYPTQFVLVPDNGHTGLPDRDLLGKLLPASRGELPRELWFLASDGVVRDHYWLRLPQPVKGQRLVAQCREQQVQLELPADCAVELWLDARLVDVGRPLEVSVGERKQTVALQPSLRTLCQTMAERGDPWLAASVVVPVAAGAGK